ncbi:hypothetical protein EK21DRAFT_110896 [Setomelanomma holmii]|uniref:Uncharacterized protein n=1 Tax=Setomelanomma holmii TaxID=210430 RepID=A0A9P4HAS6_9PLEO|nr:hypothetical protein EK21DRAFT_110896 [Setomelanomma holmii]
MPFLVRPPASAAAADDILPTYAIMKPDAGERRILHDLVTWSWRVTQHDFDDVEFADALKELEKDARSKRRHAHAVAGELVGHNEKPSLDELWAAEARKMLEQAAYGYETDDQSSADAETDAAIDDAKAKILETLKYVSVPVKRAPSSSSENGAKKLREWLKCIDRTRQTNGYLKYSDLRHERPMLVTRGLDHNTPATLYQPAYVAYNDVKRIHGQPPADPGTKSSRSRSEVVPRVLASFLEHCFRGPYNLDYTLNFGLKDVLDLFLHNNCSHLLKITAGLDPDLVLNPTSPSFLELRFLGL